MIMSKRNMYFIDHWQNNLRFSSWIEKGDKNTSVKCQVCCKLMDLSSMGVSSLVSHAAGEKRCSKLSLPDIQGST